MSLVARNHVHGNFDQVGPELACVVGGLGYRSQMHYAIKVLNISVLIKLLTNRSVPLKSN